MNEGKHLNDILLCRQAPCGTQTVGLLYHDNSILLVVLSSPPPQVFIHGLPLGEPQSHFQSLAACSQP